MLTQEGIKVGQLMAKYNLGAFWQPQVGNAVFTQQEFLYNHINVLQFLQSNTNWVLGFENCDPSNPIWYICEIGALQG